MKSIVICLLLMMQVQEAPPPAQTKPNMWEQMRQLVGAMKQFSNWDEQYTQMMDSIETVFVAQGWNSEPDEFSLQMIKQTEAIPPWQVQERFDLFVNLLSERYGLDDEQLDAMRQILIRDSTQLFARNSDKIMSYAVEAITTRASGQPFTSEQVARWSSLAEPVIRDARDQLKSSSQEFMQHLKPEQKAKVEQDYNALNRRADRLEEMSKDWKAGKWNPSDWGMANDPIQTGKYQPSNAGNAADSENVESMSDKDIKHGVENAGRPRGEREAAENNPPAPGNVGGAANPQGAANAEGSAPQPGKPAAIPADADPKDPWAVYVRDYINKYRLTDDQQQKAWLFYKDAMSRRDAAQKAAAKSGSQPTPKEATAIERLFERLKQRLEILPTRAQRKVAEPPSVKAKPATSQPK